MRKVVVTSPSFPNTMGNAAIDFAENQVWQVICGDQNHWRAGIYSPSMSHPDEIKELECHTCPELFLLLQGHITLVLFENNAIRELPLELKKPVLVTAPHAGYCPDGPFHGLAFVIERDAFETAYRSESEWSTQPC
jgi:hypothetical protein